MAKRRLDEETDTESDEPEDVIMEDDDEDNEEKDSDHDSDMEEQEDPQDRSNREVPQERAARKQESKEPLRGDGSYFEKDVLMGRGKRVSEWPGNIHFRQLIARNRERYLAAPRHEKVLIADSVIEQIHAIGGRFLKEDENGAEGWFEVDQERAVEKTCQALREKDKSKTPTGDPFLNPNKKTTLGPYPSGKAVKGSRKKRSRTGSDVSEGSDDHVDSDDTESFHSDQDEPTTRKASGKSVTSTTLGANKTSEKSKPAMDSSNVILQIRQYNEREMLKRLNQFKTVYGHCGVPPGWPKDMRLADWCSAQRQVYREIMAHQRRKICSKENEANAQDEATTSTNAPEDNGYRKPSRSEDELLKELEDMDFVWNYEEWHWRDRYEQLMAVEHGDLEPETAAFTRKVLVRWLANEREQVRTGATVLTKEQMDDLKRAGIVL